MEKIQSLLCEVEALNQKRVEMQVPLDQEEQKSASSRKKLNVAVRKGQMNMKCSSYQKWQSRKTKFLSKFQRFI